MISSSSLFLSQQLIPKTFFDKNLYYFKHFSEKKVYFHLQFPMKSID